MPISVIIIARNEEAHLPRLLARLGEMPEIAQIIVSDGGSSDCTRKIARAAGAEVVEAKGRGRQLNVGAAMATEEILWFLHADCLPARSCGAQLSRAIKRGQVGGHFRLRFESRSGWARLFELVARVQAQLGVFYGDSGIYATRRAFDELGGFEEWPLFEDLDFARRVRRIGATATLPGRLSASARRFEKQPCKTLLIWLELQIRFDLKQSPEKLAHLYRERF
ncbi:glycosyltransferase [bacterium]|nr:MAG: glycosyltransferase [bacterium]